MTPIGLRRGVLLLVAVTASGYVPAWADTISEVLMRSTFKIEAGHRLGTAFLMGEPIPGSDDKLAYVLMTASHVLQRFEGDSATLHLRVIRDGNYQRFPFPIQIRREGKPLWTGHPKVDVAAMRVALPREADVRLLSTEYLATEEEITKYEIAPGQECDVLGFPYGAESNDAGFPILRSGKVASFPLTPVSDYTTFLLDFEVFNGNSGGPVFMALRSPSYGGAIHMGQDVVRIMGLVSEQMSVSETVRSFDEVRRKEHKLALAVVPQAQFLRELLNQLPPRATPVPSPSATSE